MDSIRAGLSTFLVWYGLLTYHPSMLCVRARLIEELFEKGKRVHCFQLLKENECIHALEAMQSIYMYMGSLLRLFY